MNRARPVIIAVFILSTLVVAMSSVFIVQETEQVIITQFGKPVGEPIVEPGIHFKAPLVQQVNFFDRRFLEWDGSPNQIPTKDKRFIWVDTYARWRIKDPLLFFQRVRDERGAQSRLDDILDGETRNAIAKHFLVEVVRSSNREQLSSEEFTGGEVSPGLATIKFGRENITRSIIEVAAGRTLELGIELLDLRLKRINYVDEVQQKIFERMNTERKRIADKYRSEGQGEASKILGDKERELKKIQSGAYKTAQEIIGRADAEATAIYAKAYNQSEESREFYGFIKTMETYKTTMSEKDWLVLSTKGDFFKYLQRKSGK
ncbi:MAG: protease modulator HflC [Nitrospirota bacterium]|nr:protease modulator HflC [Nitrospirota bacterium]